MTDRDKLMRESYARERYQGALRDAARSLAKARREIMTWQRAGAGHSHLITAYAQKLDDVTDAIDTTTTNALTALLEAGLPIEDNQGEHP